jgi:hypothetical protein
LLLLAPLQLVLELELELLQRLAQQMEVAQHRLLVLEYQIPYIDQPLDFAPGTT